MAAKTDFNIPPQITFKNAVRKMKKFLVDLDRCSFLTRLDFTGPSQPGVYVFYERKKVMYVGRTDNLRRRIQEHGRLGSGHNSAPFAYNMAKAAARKSGIDVDCLTRAQLCGDMRFSSLFIASKERVRQMKHKFVVISDPHLQVLFEVYAALELNARWTTFANT